MDDNQRRDLELAHQLLTEFEKETRPSLADLVRPETFAVVMYGVFGDGDFPDKGPLRMFDDEADAIAFAKRKLGREYVVAPVRVFGVWENDYESKAIETLWGDVGKAT